VKIVNAQKQVGAKKIMLTIECNCGWEFLCSAGHNVAICGECKKKESLKTMKVAWHGKV